MVEPLDSFVCPITQELMVDPVVTDDGHSYEHEAIKRWLRANATSPVTNLPLRSKTLLPNHALKRAIADFRSRFPMSPSSSGASTGYFNLTPAAAPVSTSRMPTRRESLPQTGYFVYQLQEDLELFTTPSFSTPSLYDSGGSRWLLSNERVVVDQRAYATDSNHVFLRLSDDNEPGLRKLFIQEQAEFSPFRPVVVRLSVVPQFAVFRVTSATRFYHRPWATVASTVSGSQILQQNQIMAASHRVTDPESGVAFVRVDSRATWVPASCLAHHPTSTARVVVRVKAATGIYAGVVSRAQNSLATLQEGTLVASQLHFNVGETLFARVSAGGVVGWCTFESSDLLPQCPPRLAEQSAGRHIPVAILQGEYHLLVLNEVQSDGSITQKFKYCIPHAMARQIDNCIAKGRHVTHAALGPNGQWYLSGTKPDGTGAYCWASENAPWSFRQDMAVNSRVAFGRDGKFLELEEGGQVYEYGTSTHVVRRLSSARKVVAFGFVGYDGEFVKDDKGAYSHCLAGWFKDDILDAKPPRGFGALCSVSYTGSDYVAIHEHDYQVSADVPGAMDEALDAFYGRHHQVRNDRRRLIQQYHDLL
ncbi:hypothetical protein ACHHYP_06457 [Achlya hypogyna]|uniref:U-box domain-containing protein n=1 Tax=Achlya hypogyna TaxID=1202772 RepID=A0A1V9YTQ3_ACHHY|nr:hypothetical protein ACHHYP_06457 [Achlya hypogyna]